jgi:transcriptional regulator with XRE-family HTH domain
MANRQSAIEDGRRHGARLVRELGDELREARLAAGLTQQAVAMAARTSRRHVAWIESARLGTVPIADIAVISAVVGLRLHVRVYPAGPPLRDRAQLALIDRFRRRLHPDAEVKIEVPIASDPRDQRAWDVVVRLRAATDAVAVGVEAITRLRDVQAQARAAQLKRQDSGAQRLVLLVAATHANRRALRHVAPLLEASFPVRARRALAALAEGRDPGGDALILL